jgi:hypothetical protein
MKSIRTVANVIVALGGDVETAMRFGRSPQCVRNWRYAGKIPPGWRKIVDAELKPLGMRSAPSVYASYKPYTIKSPRPKPRSAGQREAVQ